MLSRLPQQEGIGNLLVGHATNDDAAVLRFNGDQAILNSRLTLNGVDATVVGIAPHALSLISNGDIWRPLTLDLAREIRLNHVIIAVGRMRRSRRMSSVWSVGDRDPVQAVRDALARFPVDEIIVRTLPRAVSHWLRRDVPARLRRAFPMPVTHLQAEK